MSQIGSRQSLETRRAEDHTGPPPGVASRRPAAALRTLVSSYSGYHLTGMDPGEIRGLPSRSLTLIVALDDPISFVSMPDRRMPPASFWSMIGGLHTAPAVVGHRGRQHGVQVDLTPIGACSVLGILPGEVGSAVVALADVAPRLASTFGAATQRRQFVGQLLRPPRRCAPGHGERARGAGPLGSSRVGPPRRIERDDRHRDVGALGRFEQPPPLAAVPPHARDLTQGARTGDAIRRRAQELLRSRPRQTIASVAATCGYADQAHMTRDWHAFCRIEPWAMAPRGTPIRSRRDVRGSPDSVT